MTQTTDETQAMQGFAQFAQAVGNDYKTLSALVTQLEGQISQLHTSTQITQQIEQAITALKNELMGGELDAQLDTLKELGDKLKALESDGTLKGAILTKFTELTQEITALKERVNGLFNVNLLEIYTTAKTQRGA